MQKCMWKLDVETNLHTIFFTFNMALFQHYYISNFKGEQQQKAPLKYFFLIYKISYKH